MLYYRQLSGRGMLPYAIEYSAKNNAQESAAVTGGICQSTCRVRRDDQPLGKREDQAEHHSDEKAEEFLRRKRHSL